MTKQLPQEIESMVQEIEILFHHNTGDYIDGVREIVERYLSLPKQENTTHIEQLEARVKYIEDTTHKIIDNNLKIRKKLNVLIEDYNKR